jgi:predicted enzyme related to lactoylglutathione lyase
MAVKRVVANISADDTGSAKAFYGGVLDMTMAMDLGWIVTFVAKAAAAPPQVSIATEGGAGTAVPDISIEVDNLDEVHRRAVAGGFDVEYGQSPSHGASRGSTSAIPSADWSTSSPTCRATDNGLRARLWLVLTPRPLPRARPVLR